jgi:DDE superfamily endonuclease
VAAERRAKAKIPDSLTFQTKLQLAVRMQQRAWADGVPLQWVVGDGGYGTVTTLRKAMATAGRYYALERPRSARIRTPNGIVETVEVVTAPPVCPPSALPRTDYSTLAAATGRLKTTCIIVVMSFFTRTPAPLPLAKRPMPSLSSTIWSSASFI